MVPSAQEIASPKVSGCKIPCTERVTEETNKLISVLIEQLKDPKASIRSSAAYRLRSFKPTQKIIEALMNLMETGDDLESPYHAACTLQRYGSDAGFAVQRLIQLIKKGVWGWPGVVALPGTSAVTSFDILYSIGQPSAIELAKLCADKNKVYRFHANRVLADILTGKSPDPRASYVLSASQAKDFKTEDALDLALTDKSEELRLVAASTLWYMRRDVPKAVKCLTQILRSGTTSKVRAQAALELGKTGEIGIDTVPFLVEALRYSKDSVVRGAAAEALGELGAIARDAVPSLEAASVEESKDVRKKAVRALQKIRLSTNKQTGFVLP